MIDDATLAAAETYMCTFFEGDSSGHDAEHTMRVYRLALRIAADEGSDQGVVGLAALLHDVDDAKLSPQTAATLAHAREFLESRGVAGDEAQAVMTAIAEVSFSKNGGTPPSTLESACLRDADRLDAIGAIGIARAFAFGGSRGRALHDPSGTDGQTTIAHFYEKLLKLKDMMCTETGRRLAEGRDHVLRTFLDEFYAEWDGLC